VLGRRICLALAGIAVAVTAIAASQAQVQAQGFSAKLIQQIEDARKAAQARKYEDALEIYGQTVDEAVTGAPDVVRKALVDRAGIYELILQFPKAEADLTSALKVLPVDPNLYADRGYFYMRRNRLPDALNDFMSGARLAPDRAKFHYGIGRVQAGLANFAAAIDSYTDAIAADPKGARAYLSRAEAEVRLGRWVEARADYDRALALGLVGRGDQYFARLGRGYVGLMQTQYSAAVADFDAALAIEPTATRGLLWRSYANERRGRFDLAIADAERAAAVEGRDPTARRNLERLRSRNAAAGPLPRAE
jgi:tetratricopeptide (TPR) repeat protein